MKKAYLLTAAILLLALLVACAPMETAEEKDNTTEKEDDTKEAPAEKDTVEEKVIEPKKEKTKEETKETAPKTETKDTDKKTETKAAANLPEAIQSKIDAANTKLKSMSYLYGSPENEGRFLDTYHVLGDKIKVKLYEDNYYVVDDYFDTVYLDDSLKTATGRCEHQRRCISTNTDNTKKIFNANYDDYRRKTPYEWLSDISAEAKIDGPEIVDKRSALKIEYPKGENKVEMWLDETYGVPLQIKIIDPEDNEEFYQFTNVQFNSLKEEDVLPAFTEAPEEDSTD
ncbi:hypothetical protein KY338_02985 [Candidatus Woesearchaeota archaeon]|nr:hypothetical protein [Candidatus Woesearchaeota archaeon]MBW3005680.1 hypothetical protein [Candidatus Woesearchaeota archaeon]